VRLSVGPGNVQIEVRDHGIGLDPRDAARIFDRFERAVSASHYGGLGLGLYIARQIVKAHGGEISVDSKPNQGATFTVTLPYNHAEGAAVAALVQEHSAAGLR
jgi:signal transduction histidine kinase